MLTNADRKHWAPVPEVVGWLADRLPARAKVLEIGPGHARFPRATAFVDFVDIPGIPARQMTKCDLARDPLPFANKSFDFVYCRHMLEDMFDPFPICAEMSRVGKAGYIETPSPIAEMCRGIDGGSPAYRGYHHHRFMAWAHRDSLWFVSKYPLVEYISFDDKADRDLRSGPKYWNTYYLWSGAVKARHIQSPLDYDIPRDYGQVVSDAMEQSAVSSDEFWSKLQKPQKPARGVELRGLIASNA